MECFFSLHHASTRLSSTAVCVDPQCPLARANNQRGSVKDSKPEARCLPLSESEEKRGGYVIPKYELCNGSKDEG